MCNQYAINSRPPFHLVIITILNETYKKSRKKKRIKYSDQIISELLKLIVCITQCSCFINEKTIRNNAYPLTHTANDIHVNRFAY